MKRVFFETREKSFLVIKKFNLPYKEKERDQPGLDWRVRDWPKYLG